MAGAEKFPEDESRGVYRAIRERRDVRSGFLPELLDDEVLGRLLEAAHHAPSVGLMQPWRFILIRTLEIRKAIHDIFLRSNQAALDTYEGDRAKKYASLKLEGILEAPSASSAIQNLNGDIGLAAIQCRKWHCTRQSARCRTYGSRLARKGLVSAG